MPDGSWLCDPCQHGSAAERVYQRFVDQVAGQLVKLGACAEPDRGLAEAAIEAVRRAVNRPRPRPRAPWGRTFTRRT
jgi:hypothetical protein